MEIYDMGKKLTLKVEGEELTKKDIKERFDKYNKMYFGGKLGKCEILWGLVNNADYGAYHAHEKEDGLHSRIWVGRNTIWTEEGLRELLVHEMIHMYVRTVEGKRMDGLLGHGRRFRRHCRRLKRDYGLLIRIHSDFGYINSKLKPKLWEKIVLWIIDR